VQFTKTEKISFVNEGFQERLCRQLSEYSPKKKFEANSAIPLETRVIIEERSVRIVQRMENPAAGFRLSANGPFEPRLRCSGTFGEQNLCADGHILKNTG